MNEMETSRLSEHRSPQKLLLRVGEVAEMLSVARSKAYAMVQSGELPSVRLGRSVRVVSAALFEYVDRLSGAERQ